MTKIAILGSGMAAFGAAHQVHAEGIKPVMFDKNPYHGGHTASFTFDNGFTIDEGPHLSFTKNARLKELFERSVGGQFTEKKAKVNNYWKGSWIKHPAQCNLHGLPVIRTGSR